MDVNELWEKFGFLTTAKSKEDFIQAHNKMSDTFNKMSESAKEELKVAVKDFVKSLGAGYDSEDRFKRQWKILNLIKYTDKSEKDFVKEATDALSKPGTT